MALRAAFAVALDGKQVGTHDGTAYFTLGQRRGIGLGGEGEAWFVVKKDPEKNIVYVERGSDHPALYCNDLQARDLTWLSGTPPKRCHAKIRYRQKDTPCEVAIQEDRLLVRFDEPQRAATPGQSIVLYDGDICLGGGVIC